MPRISPSLISKELTKRASTQIPDVLAGAFKEQREFVLDPSKLKAAKCTRRAAKSYSAGLYLFKEALENPGTSLLYLALTRESAKRIMVKDVLKVIDKKFKLGAHYNKTELSFTLPNGSIIYLSGADADEDEKNKLFGQKYKLVIIDEAASFTTNLHDLVYVVLKPAVADYRGTICLISMPSNITKSLYYDITTGTEGGWSVHSWDTTANPYMVDNWRAELEDIRRDRPLFMETPRFKQMYLGQWVIDEDALVYKYKQERCTYEALPMYAKGDWQFILGVDLGYEDSSAFVVVGFHEYDKNLYIVDCFKKQHMDITDVADKIKGLKTVYGIHKVIVDNANKQAVEEIQKRHGITLTPADKTGKSDFIEIMNSELIQGKIKLHKLRASELASEWQNLIWKEKGLKREENPNCDNHLSDACLYAWRYTYQYLSEKPILKPAYATPAWFIAEQEAMEEAAIDYFTAQAESDDY